MGFEVYPQMRDVPPAIATPHGTQEQPPPREPTGQFGWRMVEQGNASKIATGGEGFTTEDHAERAIANVMLRAQEILHPGTYTSAVLNQRRDQMLDYLRGAKEIRRVSE